MKNYYKILGVSEDASQEEIKKAYRDLSKKHHPDTSQTSDDKFKEIQEAYSYIGDKQKRRQYDAERRGSQAGPNPFGTWSFHFGGGEQPDEEDMFEEMFRRFGFNPFESKRGYRTRKKKGADIKLGVKISLEEAFEGKELSIPIRRRENANGKTKEVERTFRLNIKKGFKPGKPIVLKGEGHTGENGGENGNIVVIPQLKPHKFFRHNGPHLECTVNIYFTQAILGDTIHIKHPNGETLWIEIPSKTTHGSVITLKNKGYPVSENSYGDLKVKIHIEMPDELSTEEEELIKQLHSQSNKKKKEFNFK